MTERRVLPPHLSGAAFHVRDVDFHESSRSRLRAQDVQRPFTAVRAVGLDLDSLRDRCLAYEPLLRAGDAFSHETAAALLGLPLPPPPPESEPVPPVPTPPVPTPPQIHITSQPGVARARTRGVTGHTSRIAVPTTLHAGLPVVDPALVWCQLAESLGREDLVAVGDALITGARTKRGRKRAITTPAALERAAAEWGSNRGARTIAWALPRIRCGAESRPETITRLVLVEHGFPEPVPNDPTPIAGGQIRHPDLKWRDWRIVFEYEGDGHRENRTRWQRDIRRKRDFEAAGWIVIRVTSDDLFTDRAAFLARVHDYVRIAEARAARS